jgi:hypothetical protein
MTQFVPEFYSGIVLRIKNFSYEQAYKPKFYWINLFLGPLLRGDDAPGGEKMMFTGNKVSYPSSGYRIEPT